MGKKEDVINKLFLECKKKNNYTFHNNDVRRVCDEVGFGNQFDATKIDNRTILPSELIKADKFIVHLGMGYHSFVSNINYGYRIFENILVDETINWPYRKSILNEHDTSESNILSVASNQRIIHDFLYNDIVANPKVYGSRRTKTSFNYQIGNEYLFATNLQIEIDLTLEYSGTVTIVEGKNGFPNDFAVYQIFNPFMYYKNIQNEDRLPIKKINCCYICREKTHGSTILRLFLYTFINQNYDSINLIKKAQYTLFRR